MFYYIMENLKIFRNGIWISMQIQKISSSHADMSLYYDYVTLNTVVRRIWKSSHLHFKNMFLKAFYLGKEITNTWMFKSTIALSSNLNLVHLLGSLTLDYYLRNLRYCCSCSCEIHDVIRNTLCIQGYNDVPPTVGCVPYRNKIVIEC